MSFLSHTVQYRQEPYYCEIIKSYVMFTHCEKVIGTGKIIHSYTPEKEDVRIPIETECSEAKNCFNENIHCPHNLF